MEHRSISLSLSKRIQQECFRWKYKHIIPFNFPLIGFPPDQKTENSTNYILQFDKYILKFDKYILKFDKYILLFYKYILLFDKYIL